MDEVHPSCSRGRSAISSCAPRRGISRSASFSGVASKLRRCAACWPDEEERTLTSRAGLGMPARAVAFFLEMRRRHEWHGEVYGVFHDGGDHEPGAAVRLVEQIEVLLHRSLL